jgi:hypothetical protein
MKIHRVIPLATLFIILGIVLGGCTPATASYTDKLYYRDLSTPTQSGYDFIQFYNNGFFTYCNVTPTGVISTAEDVYQNTCKQFLTLVPGATGIPGEAGNYVIVGKQITLNYPSVDNYMRLLGIYSSEKLIITASDGSTWEYVPYPPK